MRILKGAVHSALLLNLIVAAAACDPQSKRTSSSSLSSTVPLEKGVASLQRQPGQKEYLNLVQEWASRAELEGRMASPAAARELADAVGGRTALDADEYSLVGDRLVVLHRQKGLSVVTGLKRGADGKVIDFKDVYQVADKDALNNTPELLYQWPELDLVLVVGTQEDKHVARLVDVSKDGKGYFAEQELSGRVVDHRLVTAGKEGVLYVASAVYANEKEKGAIASYAVSAEGFKPVGTLSLDRAVADREVMGIVATTIDNAEKFFLLAPLASHYNVRREGDTYKWEWVEGGLITVDISDPQGKFGVISELPVAGTITKRGYTGIAGKFLDVASQTTYAGVPAIAVEQVELTDTKDVISEEEANKRLAAFDKSFDAKYDEALKAKRERLNDPKAELTAIEKSVVYLANYKTLVAEAKLSQAYIEKDQRLVKVKMNWSEYIVGLEGAPLEGAQIKDVRFIGDLIQIAWLPVTKKDPVSIYQRGSEGKDPRRVALIKFDGSFDRMSPFIAINPFSKQEELFLVGYGVQPTEDRTGETPMVRAYRLQARPGADETTSYEEISIAATAIGDKNVRLDYRTQDRYADISYDEKTQKVSLLVQANRYIDRQSQSGGIFVTLDMAKYFASNHDFVSVSPFIVGNELDQIFRMFYKPSGSLGDAITSLGNNVTFFAGPGDTHAPLASVLSTIELLKGIAWYDSIGQKEDNFGVQFINKTLTSRGVGFEARLVSADKADSSKYQALHTGTFVPGRYVAQHKLANGSILVVSSDETDIAQKDRAAKVQYNAYLTKLSVGKGEDGKPQVVATTVTRVTAGATYSAKISALPNDENSALVVLNSYGYDSAAKQEIWLYGKSGAREVTLDDGQSLSWTRDGEQSVLELDKKLYLVAKRGIDLTDGGETVRITAHGPNVKYKLAQYFLVPFEVTDDEVVLGRGLNIPGAPLALQGKYLLTDDAYASSVGVTTEAKMKDGKPVFEADGKTAVFEKVISEIEPANQYTLVEFSAGSAHYKGGRYEAPAQQPVFQPWRGEGRLHTSIRDFSYHPIMVNAVNDSQFVLLTRDAGQSEFVTLKVTKNGTLTKQSVLNVGALVDDETEYKDWSVIKTMARKDKGELVVLYSANPAALTIAAVSKGGLLVPLKVERLNGSYEESPEAIKLSKYNYVQDHQLIDDEGTGVLSVTDTGFSEVRQYKVLD